ncbi:MAG: NBR1-Ig-like domain-containing protein, partial [Anaerolineae bacterium]
MKAFSKIGFHTSVGGNPTGIGDHLRRLDAAGVPFFIKAADSMTGLGDAQAVMRKSSVPHTAVYRRSVRYPGCASIGNPDVPDYKADPEEAARDHWAWHKAGLPPELDKDLIWIETINEVRTEVKWADWLGQFAYHSAQIMMAEGYRFSAFGYSSGTPDEGAWETDGMLRYLELCQQHPDKASISLHEYSYKVHDIWFLRGDHIGRFEKLFAACDKHKIKRPKVLITEWGWTYNDLPDVSNAMIDIASVAEYYAHFPEVLGAAIWWLGPGFGGIANKAQKLIKPLTDYSIATRFDVPDPKEEKEKEKPVFPTPIEPPPVETPQSEPNGRFINDVTIPDDTHITAGKTFTKTWLVENNGEVAWGAGYKFVHTDGEAMTDVTERPLPAADPGQQINITIEFTAPTAPGAHFSDWRFQTPDGRQFGDIIYTRIIADAPPPDPTGVSDGRWVADVTIPDDMKIEAGTDFTKTWRVRNSGTRAWGAGFTLEFAGGTPMNFQSTYPLPAAAPGQEVEISVPMRAPLAPGTHYSDFRMKDEKGNFFGEILYARIQVPMTAVSTLTPPLSQRDPLWVNARLGHAGSPKTIGEWGCLLTCFTMVANTYGRNITPLQLNHAMVSNGGFLNGYLTKWNALSSVYKDIVYEGKFAGNTTANLLSRIDSSLAAGRPVTIQVDFTSDTPYTDNDQHWVLIVAKDGDDYRINDPWLLPAQEASLKARYGRAGKPLRDAIMAAIFYRSAAVVQPQPPRPPDHAPGFPVETARLQTGMNVNPDAPHSNPYNNDDLKGLDWVRFVFKLDARVNLSERGHIEKAFAQYDPIVRDYNKMGVKTLFVINQETIWGNAPWNSNSGWRSYAANLAQTANQIAAQYRRYGAGVGYEIWNEGDKPKNPASVFVPADKFAIILKEVAGAIRAQSPESPLVFGGLATGPEEGIAYLKKCKAALNGPWPVDAIGIHPYTRWATRAPFDWG